VEKTGKEFSARIFGYARSADMRILHLAALLAIAAPIALATSIVGVWTPKRITIAADSKQTLTSASGTVVGSQCACKIYQVRGIVFALAGLAKAEQVDVIDDIRNSRELVEQGTGRKLPEDSIVVAAEAAVAKVVKARGRQSDPSIPIELLIAGNIGGKLQMFHITMNGMVLYGAYAMPNQTRRIAYPESRGYGGTDPNRGIEFLAYSGAAKAFQTKTKDWTRLDDVTLARKLVTVEATES
jgi:hypothetical protein